MQEETNGHAIVHAPGRAPLLVAPYLDTPKLDMQAREAVLREVGQVFVQWANDGMR
ncbi:MAG: hypothetical protein J0H67_00205 [Rhodospirillales bacterium]|nr:hypothetical protein [Rhodospirillales bacterium]